MKIRFYKDPDGRWYADLPEYVENIGKKEDCEMVAGADRWLDILSPSGEITLDVSTESGEHKLTLAHLGYDAQGEVEATEFGGATYRPGIINDEDHSWRTLWLCPVTLFVFGNYPPAIYYTVSTGPTDNILKLQHGTGI
jgi:hypothetical protein